MPAGAPIPKWRSAMFVAWVSACAPIAPLIYAYVRVSRAIEARRHARFVPVRRVDVDRGEFALYGDHGVVARIAPSTVHLARWYTWGDGIDGSAYDVGLLIDGRVRVCATGWPPDPLAPLVAALGAARAIPSEPDRRRHPDEHDGYLGVYALLGGMLDALSLGGLVWWLRAG